ncbi:MAG: dTDP-4-dehydrorhamnose reductase [Phycisphaerales bacterium]|nr:dTDP-4-dehydrorhamnose reductase [Phycisphaerales bacterium]
MSRIAIFGSQGQLGHDVAAALGAGVERLDRPEVDVCDEGMVAAKIHAARPDVIINCAAMTDVDLCEAEPGRAYRVNAAGALHIARTAAEVNAYLIHISTDYVFGADASRQTPYVESDPTGPVNAYGQSKCGGERFVQSLCPRHCVIRTAGLYGAAGPRGKNGNFVDRVLARAMAGESLHVVNDQRTSPTSTRALATLFPALLERQPIGIVHLASSDVASWYDVATAILELRSIEASVAPIASTDYPGRAPRPEYSALGSERLAGIGLPSLPPWRAMLKEYLIATRSRQST